MKVRATSRAHKSLSSARSRNIQQDKMVAAFDKTINGTTDYSNMGISQLNVVEIPSGTSNLMLCRNPFKTLDGLSNTNNLVSLNLENSDFESFKNCPSFPSLTSINVLGTPIMKNPAFKSAIIILIPTIRKINGELVTRAERKIAESFNIKVPLLLRNGWQITLHPPNEAETYHILNRLLSVQNKQIQAKRAEIKHENIKVPPPNSRSLNDKLNNTIESKTQELEELKKQLQALE